MLYAFLTGPKRTWMEVRKVHSLSHNLLDLFLHLNNTTRPRLVLTLQSLSFHRHNLGEFHVSLTCCSARGKEWEKGDVESEGANVNTQ